MRSMPMIRVSRMYNMKVEDILTRSKHKTRMSSATLVWPCVRVAAIPNTKHRPRYTARMKRGLNGLKDIRRAATKRLKAYRP